MENSNTSIMRRISCRGESKKSIEDLLVSACKRKTLALNIPCLSLVILRLFQVLPINLVRRSSALHTLELAMMHHPAYYVMRDESIKQPCLNP